MTTVDATTVERFATDGYLVLEGFAEHEACAELRNRALELIEGFDLDSAAGTVFSTTDPSHTDDDYFLTSGDTIRFFLEADAIDAGGHITVEKHRAVNKIGHAMHDLDPVFSRFSRQPGMNDIAVGLGIGDPRLLQSMYILKEAGTGGEVSAHTDHTFLWTEPKSVVGFWFAIDDATIDNGCLWALPGGHRQPVKSRFRRSGAETVFDVFDSDPYPERDFVPLEVPRGTLIVLDGALPHRSAPNHSAHARHAYTLHVIDGHAEYPSDNWLQRPSEFSPTGF